MSSLKFNDVTLKFGGITALNNVSFEVKPKTLYAIIGPNGAGKTSIFNCIAEYIDQQKVQSIMVTATSKT